MEKIINVGFIGNPNCGKTTLFNAYTGANLKVANWPGVTVEKKEGFTTYEDQKFRLIDLPGIYSLTSYTMEETVSRECIMSDEVDVIVDVIDASSLERNLYLALQLIELGKPVVLALNMMDIVESRGMEIDLHRLYIFSRIAKANNRHITDIISPAPTSQIPQLAHRYHYIKMYICVFTHIFKDTTYAHRLFAVNG